MASDAAASSCGGAVLRAGLLKKLKTSRKKWFVLRAETSESAARLEYYDSEKKFNAGQPAKRSIPLRTCFNINKRFDTKHKHVIALYTKDDCFGVVFESEEEQDSWLKSLLELQHGEDLPEGETPRPTFEHVWQVVVQNRGLGTGIMGSYRLCLTNKTLSMISMDGKNRDITFPSSQVRCSGNLKNYLFLEVGRNCILGAGELWLDTEDANIAQNIHTTLLHPYSVVTSATHTRAGQKPVTTPHAVSLNPYDKNNEIRGRSCSATETSKPNSNKKQFGFLKPGFFSHVGGGGLQWPPFGGLPIIHQRTQSLPVAGDRVAAPPTTTTTTPPVSSRPAARSSFGNKRQLSQLKLRDRCDSMPPRPRTASEGAHPVCPKHSGQSRLPPHQQTGPTGDSSTGSSAHSLAMDEADGAGVASPMEAVCEAPGRYSVPLTPDEAIAEEDCPESPPSGRQVYVRMRPQSSDDDGYVDMSPRIRNNYLHSPGIVSGTPSTDIRFADYQLDKVVSYLAAEEDDSRPLRAYSVGSRSETLDQGGRRPIDTGATTPEDARVRSFSTGSKAKRGPSRVLAHHQPPGYKSNSAPILVHSRSHSSHSSNDPMDNLMEMDFSRGSNHMLNNNSPKTPSGYVEMKPGVDIVPRRAAFAEVSAYVDMSGDRRHSKLGSSSQRNNNYVDMDRGRNRPKPSTSPSWYGDYLDMSVKARRSDRGSSFGSQASNLSSPRNGDYMPSQEFSTTPEGYVEMTPGSHYRQGSFDGSQTSTNEDYLNMSCGGSKKKSSRKEKAASQPISIQSGGVPVAAHTAKGSSSPISISSLLGRKSSTGTPPKMHLQLSSLSSPYASLPRQRTRKESKESPGSSVGTPGTIFPMSLNSPSSPMKPAKAETSSSSALKIPAAILNAFYKNNNKSNIASNSNNSEDYAMMDFSVKKGKENNLAKDFNASKKGKKNTDYVNYAPTPTSKAVDDADGDYTTMRPGEGKPKAAVPVKPMGHLSLAHQSASFQPIKEDVKLVDEEMPISEHKDTTHNCNASTIPEEAVPAALNECVSPAAKISRPNSANGESAKSSCPASEAPKAGPRQAGGGVTSCEQWATSSTDSDTNKLHYASLDLAQAMEEGESASPRACQKRGSQGASETAPQVEQTFLYAEIDFMKSESLKQNANNNQSLLHNAKVKH